MSEAVASWLQLGRLFLWRYRRAPRMYDGWHFTADESGCQSLSGLIDLLLASDQPALRTLTLDDPSKVDAHRLFLDHETPRLEVATKLRLRSVPDQPAFETTQFADATFDMTFGRESLERFAGSLREIVADRWDFSETYGETRVSFWRMVRKQ